MLQIGTTHSFHSNKLPVYQSYERMTLKILIVNFSKTQVSASILSTSLVLHNLISNHFYARVATPFSVL